MFVEFLEIQSYDDCLKISKITINESEITFENLREIINNIIQDENKGELFFCDQKTYNYEMGCLIYIKDGNDPRLNRKLLDI